VQRLHTVDRVVEVDEEVVRQPDEAGSAQLTPREAGGARGRERVDGGQVHVPEPAVAPPRADLSTCICGEGTCLWTRPHG
jgi:hypothetical protein